MSRLARAIPLLLILIGTPMPAGSARAASPSLAFLRIIGGSIAEQDARVAIGGNGNIFLAGTTSSTDWPVPWKTGCRLTPPDACTHVFLLKLDPAGSHTYYSLLLAGSRSERLTALAVDRDGNAYLAGTTSSSDFPMVHAWQAHCGGPQNACADGFVAKLDPRGSVIYRTYLGGSGADTPEGIAIDQKGKAYVAGTTASSNFPTVHAMQPHLRGPSDGFVTRIGRNGRHILYSTYLGGSKGDTATAIAVDGQGQAYITGSTGSKDFPTAHAFQPAFIGGDCPFFRCDDAFAVKLDPAGGLLAGTFIGTTGDESGNAIRVNGSGNVYVGGATTGDALPAQIGPPRTPKLYCGEEGDIQPCYAAFLLKLSPQLNRVIYSRMLSGSGLDTIHDLALEHNGAVVVGGYTESDNFPTVNPIQAATGGGDCLEARGETVPCDGFVTVIGPGGRAIAFSTYVGGNGEDSIESIALNKPRDIIFTGTTQSGNLVQGSSGPPSNAPRVFLGQIDGAG